MFSTLRSIVIVLAASAVAVSAAASPVTKLSGADNIYEIDKANSQNETDTQYIRDLTVHFGTSPGQMPPGAVAELTGKSNNVNDGFVPGQYVWLVPSYTTDSSTAATSFQLVRTYTPIANLADLSLGGAGNGQYRYLIAHTNANAPNKIAKTILFRSTDVLTKPPQGWDVLGDDLNQDRGFSRLYLVFDTLRA